MREFTTISIRSSVLKELNELKDQYNKENDLGLSVSDYIKLVLLRDKIQNHK